MMADDLHEPGEFDRLRAQKDEMLARATPSWIDGRPTAPGIWVLRTKNRDMMTATVRLEEYDNDAGPRTPYLRIDDGEMSEELDQIDGEIGRWVAKSYGPIPMP